MDIDAEIAHIMLMDTVHAVCTVVAIWAVLTGYFFSEQISQWMGSL